MKRINVVLTSLIMIVLLITLMVSVLKLTRYVGESISNQKDIKKLSSTEYGTKAEKYKKLKEQNPDIVAWIKIEGTKVDYPIMYTPDNPEKYLKMNFDGEYSLCGLPFIDAKCQIPLTPQDEDGANTLIYGHHMQDGTMFADLIKYEKQEFADMHRIIILDRIFEDGSVYELEFYGKKSDGSLYELDYEIYVKGGGIKDRDIEREY